MTTWDTRLREDSVDSLLQITREVRRERLGPYHMLRSIVADAIFVRDISSLHPHLPVVANLRTGVWYAPEHEATCYFKSTDGHTGQWSFSLTRPNIATAILAAKRGGCVIVDSTRKGKRFPDALSKTVPIWCCVLNRVIQHHRGLHMWDEDLYFAPSVPETERQAALTRMDEWVAVLFKSGIDLSDLVVHLQKPLRPLWRCPQSVIWMNAPPNLAELPFTPILCVSASCEGCVCTNDEFHYVQGAGDDTENWACGLDASTFWHQREYILGGGPTECVRRIREIVRTIRTSPCTNPNEMASAIGPTRLWVGELQLCWDMFEAILDCGSSSKGCDALMEDTRYLFLPIREVKHGPQALKNNLEKALCFIGQHLRAGHRILLACSNGMDAGICICIAALIEWIDDEGHFSSFPLSSRRCITKAYIRERLNFVSSFRSQQAFPHRMMLSQIGQYFHAAAAAAAAASNPRDTL